MWQPYIAVDRGFDLNGLEQAKIIKLEVVNSKDEALVIAKNEFEKTHGAVAFSVNKV